MNKKHNQSRLMWLWLIQLGITSTIAVFCLIMSDERAASSAVLGGLVCTIPHVYFARHLFKYQGALAAQRIVNAFYKGEAVKIALSALLFTAVFSFVKLRPFAFFATYILVLLTHWATPWIMTNQPK